MVATQILLTLGVQRETCISHSPPVAPKLQSWRVSQKQTEVRDIPFPQTATLRGPAAGNKSPAKRPSAELGVVTQPQPF